mmetsp:Transcript_3898/g.5804  ORF Transcript_3898/g.5804 Transcript_3898/m.5804 type:complete len:434 (-) Transcript_3898:964-2265(-)
MSTSADKHILHFISPDQVSLEIKDPVDGSALEQAKAILDEIQTPQGFVNSEALLSVAKRLHDLPCDANTFIIPLQACKEAYEALSEDERKTLNNLHSRIKAFAQAQRASISNMTIPIPGGEAGHTVSPCKSAGCYAPGGRYPLPSSVLMTAVTARAAGCQTVVLASPRPAPITLAAAYISGVDVFLGLGGAQAIGAMAYGCPPLVPRSDVIVGPGNKWVTAAKSIVNGYCGIDMLAGPSEVLVIADETANASVVAADLLAQAEHDVVARAILVSTSKEIMEQVDREVQDQLEALPEPNRSIATEAMKLSFAVHCDSIDQCITISDSIAPEHLEIQTKDSIGVGKRCANYGGLFVGQHAAEVLGDYGAGPNHTLPTGGTGRYTGGLSVFHFLRIRTWMRVDQPENSQDMVEDSIRMARLEGLEGHARAAERRRI